jgi:hypothetical protein
MSTSIVCLQKSAQLMSLQLLSQVAYFLSWPTLGTAIILVMMPSEERMKEVKFSATLTKYPIEQE